MASLRWLGQVLAWLVILGIGAILAVAVLVPRIAGATPYTVLSGSMEPHLSPGTLVVVRPVDAEDIGVGSVITYQLESGKPAVVTHRVVAQGVNAEGEVVLRTQGDANDTPDAAWVRPVQVRGELWYSVPYLGRLNNVLNGEQRELAVLGTGSLLLLYAAFQFTSAARDRLHRRGGTDPAAGTNDANDAREEVEA